MDIVETQTPTAAPAAPLTDGSQVVETDMVSGERTSSDDAPEVPGPVFREVPDDGSPAPAAAPAPARVAERREAIATLRDKAHAMKEAAQAEAQTRAAEAAKVQAEQAQARAAAERKAQIDSYLDNPEASAKEFGCAVWEVRFELSKRLGLDEATARKFHDYAAERELDQTVASTSLGRALKAKLEGDAQAAEENRRQSAWRTAQTAAMPVVQKLPYLSAHVAAQAKETGKAPEDVVAGLVVEAVEGLRTTDPRAWRRVAANEYSDAEVLAAIDRSLAPQPAKSKPTAKTTAPKPAPRVLTERERERQENRSLAAALVASGGIKKPDEGTETLDDLDAAGKWQEGLSENEINKRLARAWKRTTTAKK